jgi:hypothetical protein
MRTISLAPFSLSLLALLVPGSAAAATFAATSTSTTSLSTATIATAPTAPTTDTVAEPEVVVDLGNYDTTVIAHPTYSVVKNAPLASTLLANVGDLVLAPDDSPTGPSPTCPAATATYDWDRVFSKSDEFGNSTFGAGYWAGLTFSSRAGRAGGPDTFRAEAMAKAYATVFGSDKEVAKITGTGQMVGTQGTSSYAVRVLGVTVRSRSVSGNLTENAPIYSATFFSQSKTIWLGPVPVSFSGAVKGTLGVSLEAAYAQSTLYASAKPNAKVYAQASAGVDVWLASAGVSGTLTLVEAAVPSRAGAIVSPNNVTFEVHSDLTLASLSGKIEAYATLPGKRWTMTLASWDPLFKGTYPIIHAAGCTNPIVRPVCGDGVCQSGETTTNCSRDCGSPPPPDTDDPVVPLYCKSKPWMCSDL